MIIGWIMKGALGPFLNAGISVYREKLQSVNSHEAKEADLAARWMQADIREAELNQKSKSEIRDRWYAPENLFAYGIALPYWFTVITLDYLIFPALDIQHATGALKGDTAVAMTMIMTFWLGKRAVTSVASIIAGAFGKR